MTMINMSMVVGNNINTSAPHHESKPPDPFTTILWTHTDRICCPPPPPAMSQIRLGQKGWYLPLSCSRGPILQSVVHMCHIDQNETAWPQSYFLISSRRRGLENLSLLWKLLWIVTSTFTRTDPGQDRVEEYLSFWKIVFQLPPYPSNRFAISIDIL